MTEQAAQYRPPLPGGLKTAIAIVYFQATVNLFLGFFFLALAGGEGQAGGAGGDASLLWLIACTSLLAAALLLTCAVLVRRRYPWIRTTLTMVEIVILVAGFINVMNGTITALVGIVLAVSVLMTLSRDESREWFTRQAG